MDYKELRNKIDQARSLESSVPPLTHQDIRQLIRKRAGDDQNYLTYIDENDKRTELSYAQFTEAVVGCARFLQKHGLRHGDRISPVSHNHWHTVVQYFAAWLLGLVVVPVNLEEDDERIAYILANAKVELAFIRSDYKERMRKIFETYDNLKHIEIVICEDSTDNFIRLEEDLELKEESLTDSEALIVYTSGTTGAPKGVVLSQRNLLEDARSIAHWHNIDENVKVMCVLPIHHVNGTVVTLLTPFFAGGSTVLNQRFRTERFFPIIGEEKVHIVSVVPTLLQYLINYYSENEAAIPPSLRHIICGAGPLTVNTAKTFEQRFEIPVIHGYGLSETTCYSSFLPVGLGKDEHQKWLTGFDYPSIGVPLPANEMAIHDEEGNSLPERERGEIVIRGVNVMLGYYSNKEANEKAFKNGWFRSGDEGFYISDEKDRHYFFITGRLKELIIRGGVNLSPLEIDEVINMVPGVKTGIAVGFENKWYGEEVGAYVQMEEGAEEDEETILRFCREYLPHNKCPKVVVFGDWMPLTSTGKYKRGEVVHHFEKWRETQFNKG